MEIPIEELRPETLGGDSLRSTVTWLFWIIAIVVVAMFFTDRKAPGAEVVEVEGPAFTRFLFSNTRAGLFWLPVRLFLGFSWIESGWRKIADGGVGWLDGGSSLAGYWTNAVTIPEKGRMSFLLAGSASTNPVLFTFAIGLILAWRVAGYYGVDRYLLPKLGTPWRAKVETHSTT